MFGIMCEGSSRASAGAGAGPAGSTADTRPAAKATARSTSRYGKDAGILILIAFSGMESMARVE